jgi:hypothetical protein
MQVETRLYDGRPRIRAGRRDTEPGYGERYVYVYRLAAVAWGILDGLDDTREVHHDPGAPCLTAEWALSAQTPDEHARITRRQQQKRRAKALRQKRFGGGFVDEESTEETSSDGDRPPRHVIDAPPFDVPRDPALEEGDA